MESIEAYISVCSQGPTSSVKSYRSEHPVGVSGRTIQSLGVVDTHVGTLKLISVTELILRSGMQACACIASFLRDLQEQRFHRAELISANVAPVRLKPRPITTTIGTLWTSASFVDFSSLRHTYGHTSAIAKWFNCQKRYFRSFFLISGSRQIPDFAVMIGSSLRRWSICPSPVRHLIAWHLVFSTARSMFKPMQNCGRP